MIDTRLRASNASDAPVPYSVSYDSIRNLISISGTGFIGARHFEGMFAESGRLIAHCHAVGRPVRLLVDNRHIMLHDASAAEQLRQGAARHAPGTRVAIIVESSLARVQFRRVLDMEVHAFFSHEAEALAWLFQEDPPEMRRAAAAPFRASRAP